MPQTSFQDLISAVRTQDVVISFPTDTVPALASRPDRAGLIYETKQRSLDKPMILMAAAIEDLWPYVQGSAADRQAWQQVMAQHWPGALTLVLPASAKVPAAMNPKDPTTIGVRVPNHALARAILAQSGPLATTSANLSGQPALQTLNEIAAQFPQVLSLSPEEIAILKTSLSFELEAASGVPSTVARWHDGRWEILRQGAIQL